MQFELSLNCHASPTGAHCVGGVLCGSFLQGNVDKYAWVGKGGSFVMSEINAAVLHAQLGSRVMINAARMQVRALSVCPCTMYDFHSTLGMIAGVGCIPRRAGRARGAGQTVATRHPGGVRAQRAHLLHSCKGRTGAWRFLWLEPPSIVDSRV